MKFINNVTMSFHHGNAFENAGMDSEPFATFKHHGIVNRVLIDKLAQVMREHVNKNEKDFCNVKLTFEDWDA
jgi:hypothetical protein